MSRSESSSHRSGPSSPYPLASRERCPDAAGRTRIRIGDVEFGGDRIVVMAGPCAVETREQVGRIAESLAGLGVRVLRGGAFKPRTSPYAFQGLGVDGYRLLREAADRFDMIVVSEVLSERVVEAAAGLVDLLQVGSRSMQNFALLKELAQVDRPVLLKRGMSATYDEFLAAAEYLLSGGNERVILCERGIRTFEPRTRNSLDISAIPVLKELSHLPVVIDPSHAAGRADLVPALSRAAVAAGADGVMLEVHDRPAEARSDGSQALLPGDVAALLPSLDGIARVLSRRLLLGDTTRESVAFVAS